MPSTNTHTQPLGHSYRLFRDKTKLLHKAVRYNNHIVKYDAT